MSAPAIRATGGPRRILLATKDPLLRHTRKEILTSFGYSVAAPTSDSGSLTLIQSERFDLLILGGTLAPSNKLQFATNYRKLQPRGRIIEIVLTLDDPPFGNPDAA